MPVPTTHNCSLLTTALCTCTMFICVFSQAIRMQVGGPRNSLCCIPYTHSTCLRMTSKGTQRPGLNDPKSHDVQCLAAFLALLQSTQQELTVWDTVSCVSTVTLPQVTILRVGHPGNSLCCIPYTHSTCLTMAHEHAYKKLRSNYNIQCLFESTPCPFTFSTLTGIILDSDDGVTYGCLNLRGFHNLVTFDSLFLSCTNGL
jgi:hypothetical protein